MNFIVFTIVSLVIIWYTQYKWFVIETKLNILFWTTKNQKNERRRSAKALWLSHFSARRNYFCKHLKLIRYNENPRCQSKVVAMILLHKKISRGLLDGEISSTLARIFMVTSSQSNMFSLTIKNYIRRSFVHLI